MKKWFRDHSLMWQSALLCLMGFFLDEVISRHPPAGWRESNPFAAGPGGEFVWLHAAAYDIYWLSIMGLVGLILYFGIRKHDEGLAQFAASAWPLYQAVSSFSAVVHNLWIRLGWYQDMRMPF